MRYSGRPSPDMRRVRLLATVFSFAMIGAMAVASLAAAAQTDDSIAGDYSVTIGREDVPSDQPDGYSFVGRWIVSFNPDGTYVGERQDIGVAVSGTYEVNGDEVTITDDTGLVSCANPVAATIAGEDISSGTYEWGLMGSDLTLVPVDDGCGGRVILLTTRTLSIFVPCDTVPLDTSALVADNGSPVAVVPDDEDLDPVRDPLDILTPDDPVEDQPDIPAAADDAATIGADIDELLGQMTACWSTGDPGLWLPLLSEEFRMSLVDNSPDFESTIAAAMATPILWERAGDLDIEGPGQVSAIVRATVALEQDFQRFLFVLEDGEWRWDG